MEVKKNYKKFDEKLNESEGWKNGSEYVEEKSKERVWK